MTTNLPATEPLQGGALALIAAGLNPRIQRRTVAIYPFLSDFRRALEIGNTSGGL